MVGEMGGHPDPWKLAVDDTEIMQYFYTRSHHLKFLASLPWAKLKEDQRVLNAHSLHDKTLKSLHPRPYNLE